MLKEGLLWHLSYPHDPGRDSFIPPKEAPSGYFAPSWSWASCGKPVTFRLRREPHFADIPRDEPSWCNDVVKCNVTPRSEQNPFGAVQSAYIDIKGLLVPLSRVARGDEHTLKSDVVEDVELMDDKIGPKYNDIDIFAPDSTDALKRIDSSCYWMPIYDAMRGRTKGIIVKGNALGQYQRLGFAEFQNSLWQIQGDKHIIRLV